MSAMMGQGGKKKFPNPFLSGPYQLPQIMSPPRGVFSHKPEMYTNQGAQALLLDCTDTVPVEIQKSQVNVRGHPAMKIQSHDSSPVLLHSKVHELSIVQHCLTFFLRILSFSISQGNIHCYNKQAQNYIMSQTDQKFLALTKSQVTIPNRAQLSSKKRYTLWLLPPCGSAISRSGFYGGHARLKKVEGDEHGGSSVGQAWKGHTSSLPTSFCLEVSHMAPFEKCSLAVYPRKRGNWFGAHFLKKLKNSVFQK